MRLLRHVAWDFFKSMWFARGDWQDRTHDAGAVHVVIERHGCAGVEGSEGGELRPVGGVGQEYAFPRALSMNRALARDATAETAQAADRGETLVRELAVTSKVTQAIF
jgi:hypothetical protein